ncbi:MAG: butyrate kinase [Atopobium sp.]|uniref:butyrate kinase n=1 Tax=Atopobium sp. TaxID=1872650 RepID=UPI002A75C080|nr:butyrate kinase [Atopobium sp.]MDY2789082.1 butyrate kinase [Atopobium sp.]
MAETYKIFTVNPGATSTKVALFEGDKTLFSKNVSHEASKLAEFDEITEQIPYRLEIIEQAIADAGVSLDGLDAVVGRGGGLLAVEGGTYVVDETLLDHARRGANGITHPAQLGSLIAQHFANTADCPCFVVNPPDTDELQPVARMTGVDGVYRNVHLHALNLKETAIRHATSMGKAYEDCNFVVCHLGGGVSVSAHRRGRMIDGYDIVGGDGPMAPTRCGALPVGEVANWLDKGHTTADLRKLCHKSGGFVSHLGTSDAQEVTKLADKGNKHAQFVWDAFVYQVEKSIGAMAVTLGGKVDGILLGGGIAHSQELVAAITENCGWIAPVTAYPGEFEMEAMAAGASRVLRGVEEAKHYTGKPAFTGFNWNIE